MNIFRTIFICLITASCKQTDSVPVKQQNISRVDQMADIPQPLKIIDYQKLAMQFDTIANDFNASGKFWPIVWKDSSNKNFPQVVVGLYTAVGDVRQGPDNN